jgi:predicted RNA-binding Zn-ribbon protein involved in translation (DUF1610 family)
VSSSFSTLINRWEIRSDTEVGFDPEALEERAVECVDELKLLADEAAALPLECVDMLNLEVIQALLIWQRVPTLDAHSRVMPIDRDSIAPVAMRDRVSCPKCGKHNIGPKGSPTRNGQKVRYKQCRDCGFGFKVVAATNKGKGRASGKAKK